MGYEDDNYIDVKPHKRRRPGAPPLADEATAPMPVRPVMPVMPQPVMPVNPRQAAMAADPAPLAAPMPIRPQVAEETMSIPAGFEYPQPVSTPQADPNSMLTLGPMTGPKKTASAGMTALSKGLNAMASMIGQPQQQPRTPWQYQPTPRRPRAPLPEDELFKGYGYRKDGGKVKPGKKYIVGENGPEELVLDQPGKVIANKDIRDPAVIQHLASQSVDDGPRPVKPQVAEESISIPAGYENPDQPQPVRPVDPRSLLSLPDSLPSDGVVAPTPPRDLSHYKPIPPPDEAAVQAAALAQGDGRNVVPMPVNPALADTTAPPPPVSGPLPVNPMTGAAPVATANDIAGGAYDKDLNALKDIGNAARRGKRYEPPAPEFEPDPTKTPLENKRAEIAFRRNQQFHNHRGFLNTLKGTGLGFLQAFAQNEGLPLQQRLLASIGGAGAGLVGSIADPNIPAKMRNEAKLAELYAEYGQQAKMDEESARLAQTKAQTQAIADRPTLTREGLQAKINAATIAHQRRMDIINHQADIRSGEAKIVTDEHGMKWKRYLKPGADGKQREDEPVVNTTTGEQEFDPGEQMVLDPLTGNAVKARQILMPQATIAAGNATRQQSADATNSQRAWETDKQNIANQMQHQNQVNSMIMAAITAAGADADVTGANDRLTAIASELNDLYNTPLPGDALEAQRQQEQRVKRVNELVDEGQKIREQALNTLSKSEAGKAKAAEIRAQIGRIKAPGKLTYTPYKPSLVSGGAGGKYAGQSFASPQSLRSYFPGKSDAEIQHIVEGQGGRFQ